MALPALATVAAMEVRLGVPVGSLAGLDLDRARASLGDTSALVRSAVGGRTWVAADNVTITAPPEVVTVVVRAAIRAYRNPDGVSSESIGGAYFYAYGQAEISAYLTEDEVVIVRAAVRREGADDGWNGTGTVRTPSAYYDPGTAADPLDRWL